MKLLSAVTPPLSQCAPSISRLSSFKVQLVKMFSYLGLLNKFSLLLSVLFFFFYHPHGSGVSEPS